MSSKRRIRRRQCTNKSRFKTQKDASGAIYDLRKRDRFRGQRIYKCKFCGGWHIGRPNRHQRQRINQARR